MHEAGRRKTKKSGKTDIENSTISLQKMTFRLSENHVFDAGPSLTYVPIGERRSPSVYIYILHSEIDIQAIGYMIIYRNSWANLIPKTGRASPGWGPSRSVGEISVVLMLHHVASITHILPLT